MRNIGNIKGLLVGILLICICMPLVAQAAMPSADARLGSELVSAGDASGGDVSAGEEAIVEPALESEFPDVSDGNSDLEYLAISEEDEAEVTSVSDGDASVNGGGVSVNDEGASVSDKDVSANDEGVFASDGDMSANEGNVSVSAGDVSANDGSMSVSSADSVSNGDVAMQNTEILKVILPIDFAVLLYKEAEEMKLESQDILLINKSDVAVAVKVKAITFEVKGENTAQALTDSVLSVNMKVFQADDYMFSYEPDLFEPFQIGLDKAHAETNADQLLAVAESWNPIGAVESPDYCILRVKGIIPEAYVHEKDVNIGIVFEFERAMD